MATIKPEIPGGFRDYLPREMIQRQSMLDTIRGIYESFGFSPLETPAIERTDVLTGGQSSMVIYNASLSRSEPSEQQALSLRFDLTVPLARVVSAYPNDLPRPFRRYQCAKVWRGEKPQAGRFREFMQFDADVVGSDSMLADAEIIWLMQRTMTALGFTRFVIRFNNRKILNALALRIGIGDVAGDKAKEFFRILDKLEKIQWEGVEAELRRLPESSADAWALALNDEQVAIVRAFIHIDGDTDQILADLPKVLGDSPMAVDGVNELKEIVSYLQAINLPVENWTVDLSVARGLDYYTGPVFETTLLDAPEMGSVFSGGRYDGLVSRFSSAMLPATGASIGVDRLFAAMEKLGLIAGRQTVTDVLIIDFTPVLRPNILSIAGSLRSAGINTEIYEGTERSFKAQLAYATSLEIPIVLILGDREASQGVVQLKNMRNRTQISVPVTEIAEAVRQGLAVS